MCQKHTSLASESFLKPFFFSQMDTWDKFKRFRKFSICCAKFPPCKFACMRLFLFRWHMATLSFMDLPAWTSSHFPSLNLQSELRRAFCLFIYFNCEPILCTLSVFSFPFDSKPPSVASCTLVKNRFWLFSLQRRGAALRSSAWTVRKWCCGALGEISINAWHGEEISPQRKSSENIFNVCVFAPNFLGRKCARIATAIYNRTRQWCCVGRNNMT